MKLITLLVVACLAFSGKMEIGHVYVNPDRYSDSIPSETIHVRKNSENGSILDLYFDDDKVIDKVYQFTSEKTKKSGLLIKFGNDTTDTIVGGSTNFGLSFNDINWMKKVTIAKKGNRYAANVDASGELRSKEDIPESEWIKLPNDGLFLQGSETCGGGIIYIDQDSYHWIPQD